MSRPRWNPREQVVFDAFTPARFWIGAGEILVAVERLKTAESNFRMFQDSILNQSEKELEVLQASYRAGEFRFFDLINEQRRALEIRKSYIHSAREYFIALAEMEFVMASNVTGGVQ